MLYVHTGLLNDVTNNENIFAYIPHLPLQDINLK